MTDEIGEAIAFDVSEGDEVLITTEKADSPFRGNVVEKNGTAEEEGDEVEVICQEDGADLGEATILYANVESIDDTGGEFDVYAIEMSAEGRKDLGEITALRIR